LSHLLRIVISFQTEIFGAEEREAAILNYAMLGSAYTMEEASPVLRWADRGVCKMLLCRIVMKSFIIDALEQDLRFRSTKKVGLFRVFHEIEKAKIESSV
jgi:hypothetical protein